MTPAKKPSRLRASSEVTAAWKAYFAGLNPKARRAVKLLLAEIRKAVPSAVPVFSYRIPGFRLEDRALLWCAGFTTHVSLYPITATVRRTHAAALAGYKTSTGTVQFPLSRPLALPLARRLIKTRVAEVRREARRTKPLALHRTGGTRARLALAPMRPAYRVKLPGRGHRFSRG